MLHNVYYKWTLRDLWWAILWVFAALMKVRFNGREVQVLFYVVGNAYGIILRLVLLLQ